MARKTFISYKYSDVVQGRGNNNLRDKIIARLGEDARFYKGENGYTENLSGYSAEYIKQVLKDKLYDTSVTIVIISPNMRNSKWIEWELEYSLRNVTRGDRTSRPNGIIAVVQKSPYSWDDYSWAKSYYGDWNTSLMPSIIAKNRRNKSAFAPYSFSNHYIDIVTEDEFLKSPEYYIEAAYNKSKNTFYYDLKKTGDY